MTAKIVNIITAGGTQTLQAYRDALFWFNQTGQGAYRFEFADIDDSFTAEGLIISDACRAAVLAVDVAADQSAVAIHAAAVNKCALLFCSPAWAADLESRKKLGRLARKRKVRCAILAPLRFHPGLARLREMIASGAYGDVRRVEFNRTDSYPPGFAASASGTKRRVSELETDLQTVNWIVGREEECNLEIPEKQDAETSLNFKLSGGVTGELRSSVSLKPQAGWLDVRLTAANGIIHFQGPAQPEGNTEGAAGMGKIHCRHRLYGDAERSPIILSAALSPLQLGLAFVVDELLHDRGSVSTLVRL